MDEYEDDDCCYDERDECPKCQGDGIILICIDDVCRGQGCCIHGDGEVFCKTCNGSGYV